MSDVTDAGASYTLEELRILINHTRKEIKDSATFISGVKTYEDESGLDDLLKHVANLKRYQRLYNQTYDGYTGVSKL